jgi:hypothetical protein
LCAEHLNLPAGGGQRKRLDRASHANLVDRLEQDEQIGQINHDLLVALRQLDLFLLVQFTRRTVYQLHQSSGGTQCTRFATRSMVAAAHNSLSMAGGFQNVRAEVAL